MKSIYRISFISALAIFMTACSSSYKPYAYDDIYYNPSDDPIKQVEKDPKEDLNRSSEVAYDNSYPNRYTESQSDNYPEDMYQNRYTETEQNENANPSTNNNNQTVIINNNTNGDVEYYDEEYAETVRKLNTPVQSFNSYDPYMQARIAYTNDPFFYSPMFYGTNAFYNPWVPSTGIGIGWNSWSGWNVGIGIGFGYSAWGCPSPFWNPWRPVWAFNPWGPSWGFGWGAGWNSGWGYGWGMDPYWAGYNNGYYRGFHDGFFYGDHNFGNSGKTYINTPRGSNGSRAFTEQRSRSRSETTSSPNYRLQNPDNGNSRVANPGTSATPGRSAQGTRSRTPERYSSGNTPETYSRSREGSSRPSSTTPNNQLSPSQSSPARPSRSRTNQARPYNNDSYNAQPPRNSRTNPSIQSRPSFDSNPSNNLNRSRPSYNRTPSYTPSPSMRGGGGSRSGGGGRSTTRPR